MNIKKVNAGVWVKCSEELPTEEKRYNMRSPNIMLPFDARYSFKEGFSVNHLLLKTAEWLKPIEGYVLSEQELVEVIYMWEASSKQKTISEFLKAINQQ